MKLLITLELTLLLLATTFQSHNPPGWIQQQLPVDDFVNDIYFLDSLTGWIATNSNGTISDTAYVMKTTNGGNNWIIQERSRYYYTKIQFLNSGIGYLCGSTGAAIVWKTTNGGTTWFELFNFGLAFAIDDIQFVNEDTGWVCSSDFDLGGIWKTTDGGNNWIRQLSPPPFPSLVIKAISILNKDTGWAINSSGSVKELYRTTNGGVNWNVQYTFSGQFNDVIFLNKDTGIVSGGVNYRTSNGGFNWIQSNDGGIKVSFANDTVGWAGNNLLTIQKTVNGGITWFRQTTNRSNPTPFALSSLNAWAGGIGLIHTTDGGGLSSITEEKSTPEIFTLSQNYPNPFNPKTIIKYELRIPGFITLKVFDIKGKEIETLIYERQNDGNYSVTFEAKDLSSGIYFYKIEVTSEKGLRIQSQTRKMILIR